MRTIPLGDSGEQVSQLALGAMLMGTRTDEPTSFRILDHFLERGGTFVDTSNNYAWWYRPGSAGGESEELLARWFRQGNRRDRVFLATKGGARFHDPDAVWQGGTEADWSKARPQFEGAGRDTLRAAIDGSLRRLGVDHVDLYYVHVDDRRTPLEESLEALAGLVSAGKTRHYGYSNVSAWRLERMRQLCDRYGWPAPVAWQQQYSYLRPAAGRDAVSVVSPEQLDYLRATPEVTLVGYSAVLKGVFDVPEKLESVGGLRETYAGPDADARIATVRKVADEVGATPNQVALSWMLHQNSPAVVALIGPRTWDQYAGAMPAIDLTLTDEQLSRLDAAGA
jgi:aryl-alcohol dehydrogenase-like predicted oxidoreductase